MSETMGECERSVIVASDGPCHPHGERRAIADAIDRLAADVATIKAKIDAVAPEDVRHFVESEKAWVAILEQDRDKMKDERNTAMMQREAAILQRDAAIRDLFAAIRCRDAALADAVRLHAELAARSAGGNSPKTSNSSPAAPQPAAYLVRWDETDRAFEDQVFKSVERAQRYVDDEKAEGDRPQIVPLYAAPQPAGQGISLGLPGTQPPRNAAPQAGWLTDRERRAVAYFAQVCRDDLVPDEWTDNAGVLRSILARAAPQPAAPAAGWLTAEERGVIVCSASELSAIGHHRPPDKEECLRLSAALRSVVKRHDENTPARAGSPPSQSAAGWLTEEERRALSRAVHLLFDDDCDTPSAGTVQALLARAGSPPVVEVPAISRRDVPMQNEAFAYRDAMDKAGVAWKEVGRG